MPTSEMDKNQPSSRTRIKVCDFLNRDDIGLDSPDDGLSEDDTLIEGDFLHRELRSGLFLHVSNVREEHAFTVTSHLDEGLSCIFFMEGNVDLKVGERQLTFKGGKDRVTEATMIVNARSDSFERRSHAAQSLRHVVISASPQWLGVDGSREVKDHNRLGRFFRDHLNTHRWTITSKISELVRQIASPPSFVPELQNLYLEGRAVEIVGESLAALLHNERTSNATDLLDKKNVVRLNRAREFIDANLTSSLTVETIAREAGINSSGLQQIFHAAEGVSIFEFVRKKRLERAWTMLSSGECKVGEAGLIAGYSNPANFTTAFKRAFGCSPREVLPVVRRGVR
jgi:AraC-like DNA-binding protein